MLDLYREPHASLACNTEFIALNAARFEVPKQALVGFLLVWDWLYRGAWTEHAS